MDTHVPMRSYLLVHDALKMRDLELLQQDPAFRQTLSQTCLCCGKSVTLTGPSQEHVLRHHLLTCHAEPKQAIECLIHMVIHKRGHDHLTTCDWCGITITPTHPNAEYDDHLAECPVLLHFATWLLIPLTPAPHGSSAGGCSHPASGCAGTPGGVRGSKRHDRDLNSLHHQNTYILFLATGPDGLMTQLLQTSAQWKQQQQNKEVTQSLRQCLMLNLVQTLLQRATKVKDCKKEDPPWTSSLQSKLVLQDASWPFLKWDHNLKHLDLDGKTPSIPMKEMIQNLEQLYKMLERPEAIIRFHALQSKTKQAPVIPWKLEPDMKDHRLHALLFNLVGN